MSLKSHKDVEFAVDHRGQEHIFKTLADAAEFAITTGMIGDRIDTFIDVLVHSEAGARWVGGDDAVAEYREDPDASVFKRIKVRVSDQGRVA